MSEKENNFPGEEQNQEIIEADKKEIVKDAEIKTKDKDDDYEKYCFLCRRPESVTGKMIELPNQMYVCPDCMQKSFETMNSGNIDFSQLMNMPGVQFLNISDLQNMAPKQQKIKKKKEEPKVKPEFNLKDIPAPHKIKARLDDFVEIGRAHV